MLQIELSDLSVQELNRLLESARDRKQDGLARQLMAELEARPTRAEDSRLASVDTSYPPEFEEEPELDRPRRTGVMARTAALAALVSAAVTWGLSMPSQAPRQATPSSPALAPAPRAAVMLASLAPVSALNDAPPPPAAEPAPAPRVWKAKAPAAHRATPAKPNPCYALATAAERLVCGYPALASRDRDLRVAYDRAKAAGADTKALDSAQASWRIASDHVTDPKVLAELYERRIRELDSAAQTARAQDPPF